MQANTHTTGAQGPKTRNSSNTSFSLFLYNTNQLNTQISVHGETATLRARLDRLEEQWSAGLPSAARPQPD